MYVCVCVCVCVSMYLSKYRIGYICVYTVARNALL